MTNDLSEELRSDRKAARRDYTASLMSNSKWRAVFEALANVRPALSRIDVKFIGNDHAKPMGLPWLDAPHAFVDSLEFGPFPLVGIEWIEVPSIFLPAASREMPATRETQDLDAAWSALEATGKQLPLSRTRHGIRITGHQI
ncbi:DUF6678 family protein [Sphingomonas sp. Leaf23]|uniref:DUF6678 family protein n=1 Tax=Sphingomonas sp. Leaf23 TaxID=1735689 RepID=UPI000A911378|nr:DUF6678 family protein [Sphingomonas sp. Leaf23]